MQCVKYKTLARISLQSNHYWVCWMLLIELWRSDIKHKFCWGVTCLLKFLRKRKTSVGRFTLYYSKCNGENVISPILCNSYEKGAPISTHLTFGVWLSPLTRWVLSLCQTMNSICNASWNFKHWDLPFFLIFQLSKSFNVQKGFSPNSCFNQKSRRIFYVHFSKDIYYPKCLFLYLYDKLKQNIKIK